MNSTGKSSPKARTERVAAINDVLDVDDIVPPKSFNNLYTESSAESSSNLCGPNSIATQSRTSFVGFFITYVCAKYIKYYKKGHMMVGDRRNTMTAKIEHDFHQIENYVCSIDTKSSNVCLTGCFVAS